MIFGFSGRLDETINQAPFPYLIDLWGLSNLTRVGFKKDLRGERTHKSRFTRVLEGAKIVQIARKMVEQTYVCPGYAARNTGYDEAPSQSNPG